MSGEQPVDLRVFFELQQIFNPQTANSEPAKTRVSQAGSLYLPNIPRPPKDNYNEVYPNIFLGNNRIVKDWEELNKLGITHVLNASMGPKHNQTDTSTEFYKHFEMEFHGVPAMDVPAFKILPFLHGAANFIEKALESGGKVYVHCQQGVSRSTTVVLAFLMIHRHMDLMDAATMLRGKREVNPNNGFLRQLCELAEQLKQSQIKDAGTLE